MSSFTDQWGFESDLRKLVPGCDEFEYQADGTFKSGRKKYRVRLYRRDGSYITERLGMDMLSKKTGKPYKLIAKHEVSPRSPEPRAARSLDQSDLYG